MRTISTNGIKFSISMMVFDKDGLMFKSQPFWGELALKRIYGLREYLPSEGIDEWASVFGVKLENGEITYTNPKGILAVASPKEEIVITAGILAKYLNTPWTEAFELASTIHRKADSQIDFKKALIPTKGFPDIFKRLRQAGIPYAIATSDTKDRVILSLTMVHEEEPKWIIDSAMVAQGKPEPDMLKLLSEKTGISISEIAMVGDSYVDLLMAKKAGAIGIGIPETEEMRQTMMKYSSMIINSLDDISIEQ